MELTGSFLSLTGGAIGGNAAGALLRRLSLGSLGDSITGIVGGALVVLSSRGTRSHRLRRGAGPPR